MPKISENNGTEEIGLVTPTPDLGGDDQQCSYMKFLLG